MKSPGHVLFVDDEEILLELFKEQCKAEGVPCHIATSGEEALRITSQDHVRVVVTDYHMNGMDGIELARRLREQRYDGPVYAYTGRIDSLEEKLEEESEQGRGYFKRIFQKPEAIQEIILHCKEALGLKKRSKRKATAKINRRRSSSRRMLTKGCLPSIPVQIIVDEPARQYRIREIRVGSAHESDRVFQLIKQKLEGKPLHEVDTQLLMATPNFHSCTFLNDIVSTIEDMQDVIGCSAQQDRSATGC